MSERIIVTSPKAHRCTIGSNSFATAHDIATAHDAMVHQ
jgi:hypothetical protein